MFYNSEVRRNFVFMKIINNYNLNLSDLLALFYSTVSLHDITKDQKASLCSVTMKKTL